MNSFFLIIARSYLDLLLSLEIISKYKLEPFYLDSNIFLIIEHLKKNICEEGIL